MGIPTCPGGVVPAMTGVYLLLIVLVAATLFGLWRKRTDGRMRPVGVGPGGRDRRTSSVAGAAVVGVPRTTPSR